MLQVNLYIYVLLLQCIDIKPNKCRSRSLAARLAGLAATDHSLNNLISKTGLSRDKLTQLARDQQLSSSSNSLSNLIERQSSYDALMSLDFQSLQSIVSVEILMFCAGFCSCLCHIN